MKGLSSFGSGRRQARPLRRDGPRLLLVEALEDRNLPSFLASTKYDTAGSANTVAVGDFNGDCIPDLAVANQYGTMDVLLGNGDGTFRATGPFDLGENILGIMAADVNGDGHVDLVTSNPIGGTGVGVLLGNGDGSFQDTRNYLVTAGAASAIAIRDLNGDGLPDLVITDPNNNLVSVLLNRPSGPAASGTNKPIPPTAARAGRLTRSETGSDVLQRDTCPVQLPTSNGGTVVTARQAPLLRNPELLGQLRAPRSPERARSLVVIARPRNRPLFDLGPDSWMGAEGKEDEDKP